MPYLLAAAVAVPPVLAAGMSRAVAGVEPGSGLASYGLSANAPTFSVTEDQATAVSHPEAEGDLPEAVSTLGSTGGAYGLSSAVWPGALAGNLGTLLIGASGGAVPQQASVLDDPVRAEAKNHQGTVTNDDYPAMSLKATSLPASASASAQLQGADVSGVLSLGSSSAASATQLVGASTVKAASTGSLHDITVAGGVFSIASLRSSASALSDGGSARASGSTTVTGATVHGVPVTIDQSGVHVAGNRQPLPGQVQNIVNSALTSLGMTVTMIGPNRTISRGTARYVASTLVITWQPDPQHKIVMIFGGASVSVAAVPGGAFPITAALPLPTQPAELGLRAQVGQVPSGTRSGGETGTGVARPGLAPAPLVAVVPAASTALPGLPGPLAIAWVLAALGLAALSGLGLLRRLPTAFTTADTARCPWEISG
jgi:hypothetical protein